MPADTASVVAVCNHVTKVNALHLDPFSFQLLSSANPTACLPVSLFIYISLSIKNFKVLLIKDGEGKEISASSPTNQHSKTT